MVARGHYAGNSYLPPSHAPSGPSSMERRWQEKNSPGFLTKLIYRKLFNDPEVVISMSLGFYEKTIKSKHWCNPSQESAGQCVSLMEGSMAGLKTPGNNEGISRDNQQLQLCLLSEGIILVLHHTKQESSLGNPVVRQLPQHSLPLLLAHHKW